MKTIILDITNDITELLSTQKVFNSMVRYAYNRLIDDNNLKEKDLRKLINETFNQPSWLSECANKDAIYLYKSNKTRGLKTVIFGGFKNLKDYLLKKKSKEQYKLDKLLPITFQGEACKYGKQNV